MNTIFNRKQNASWLHMGILAIATFIAYIRVLNAGFLSWDDGEYILHNTDIRGITGAHIKAWFSQFYIGNYHPLTLLSYTIDYMIGGVHPLVYHLSGLLLHVCNGCLVYALIKKIQPDKWVAFFVALLFCFHPIQTESVSWVAERKTVLSGLFFLLALLQYTSYVKAPTKKRLLWVLAAGAAAMLSKGTAVALPISLFAIDIWLNRPLNNRKIWTEKIPLFTLSLIMGLVALRAQESGKFLNTHTTQHFSEHALFAGYAYVQYIARFLFPTGLSTIYPYPDSISAAHYLSTILALCIVAIMVIAYRRKWHVLYGGLLFYTANIIFMLQLIPFGEALMADRYLYIAIIGLIYPVINYPFKWASRTKEGLL